MRVSIKEYSLSRLVKHLDYMYNFPDEQALMYEEISEFLYKAYVRQLEPLRLQAHEGKLSNRMHHLLTKAYQTARLIAMDLDGKWPPVPKKEILLERLKRYEKDCEDLEQEVSNIKSRIQTIRNDLNMIENPIYGTDIRVDA